jgi:hypothetical protein
MVSNSAGIPVGAFPLRQDIVGTSGFAQAGILRTGIAIIAGIDEVALEDVGLIHVAVTVIIQTVAGFWRRDKRIAIRQATVRANPLARANAKFIGHSTPGPQRQLHGLAGTGTDSSIGKTLPGIDAIHRLAVGTGETPGAIVIAGANAAAKGPLGAIVEADILVAPRALTVVPRPARLAQVWDIGDADIDHVGVAPGYLLTAPARRALLLARHGANGLAHMLDAPARLAVRILDARVEEAPGTRLTFHKWRVRQHIKDQLRQDKLVRRNGDVRCLGPIRFHPTVHLPWHVGQLRERNGCALAVTRHDE